MYFIYRHMPDNASRKLFPPITFSMPCTRFALTLSNFHIRTSYVGQKCKHVHLNINSFFVLQ